MRAGPDLEGVVMSAETKRVLAQVESMDYIEREVDAYEVFMEGNTFALVGICDVWKHSVLESAGRMS